jgi:hypothetical protein
VRKRTQEEIELPDDLGVDWSRWSDGRAYRLKRKRDFPNVDPGEARSACELAARRMGRAVRTARDKRVPTKLMWVQFADAYVKESSPCPLCGSRRLYRLHANFVRCVQCSAQLIVSAQGLDSFDDEDGGTLGPRARERMGARIKDLGDVHLERAGETESTEIYNGWGMAEEIPVIVLAEFDKGDEELTVVNMYDRVGKVKVFPAHLLGGLVNIGSLRDRPDSDWDLIP